MNFEKALTYEFDSIIGLEGKIFPLAAPEKTIGPFVVYRKINLEYKKNMNGFTGNVSANYEIVVVATNYTDLQNYSDLAVNKLISFLQRTIGTESLFIQNLTVRQTGDQYEYEANLYRANIQLEINY